MKSEMPDNPFEGCKPGDVYTVVSDDEEKIVFEKQSTGEEAPADEAGATPASDEESTTGAASAMKSDNPAVQRMIGKKYKQ